MSVAVDMLHNSLTAVTHLPGQDFIQFESMRKVRATFTRTWVSSPQGIAEGASFSSGKVKATWTSCPTEQEWFARFLRGSEIRMGYAATANRSLSSKTIIKLLGLIEREAKVEATPVAREYWKVGAAMAVATCASLCGPEALLLDLAGLRLNIDKGRKGSPPNNPLKVGTDLSEAPHVLIVLLGLCKGETGVHHHMLALASLTMSGIALRWWLEKLIEVRAEEGCYRGPAFGHADGSVASLHMNMMAFFITSS